ncbi:MAG: hypothetical protein HWD61_02500 [Parachlamydiaceae bacterium]|nr:MAG: hypothetical protein HWD61_02500 [Parachlamydiaceae bacterium]
MKLSALVVFIFALLILIGGVIGFNQAHSVPSLIAGTASGVLLIICGFGILKRSVLAYTFAMIVIFALTLFSCIVLQLH